MLFSYCSVYALYCPSRVASSWTHLYCPQILQDLFPRQVLHRLQYICSSVVLRSLQRDNLLFTMVFMGCMGTFTLALGIHLPLHPSLSWGFDGYFSYFFPLPRCLSKLLCTILPFLKYIFPEAPPVRLTGWAVSCGGSFLEPSGMEQTAPRTKTLHSLEDTELKTSNTDQKIRSASVEYRGSCMKCREFYLASQRH